MVLSENEIRLYGNEVLYQLYRTTQGIVERRCNRYDIFKDAWGGRAIQEGGFISIPYLGANLTSFCICSLLNGGGFTLVSEISKPTSTNSCSIPAGESTIISFAISLVSFLKLCQTFGGTLTNVPGLASILCSSTLINYVKPFMFTCLNVWSWPSSWKNLSFDKTVRSTCVFLECKNCVDIASYSYMFSFVRFKDFYFSVFHCFIV